MKNNKKKNYFFRENSDFYKELNRVELYQISPHYM